MPWISAGVSIGGAILGKMGSDKAGKASAKANKAAIAEQRRQFDVTQANNKPWMDRGNEAGGALQQRLGLGKDNGTGNYGELMHSFGNEDFVKDPGYQFRMDEGAKAVNNTAAARGNLLSGAAAKEMQRYSQGFASNEFGNAYNRYSQDQGNRYNRLMGISSQGQSGAQYLGQAGQNSANAISGLQQQGGQDKASSIMGGYNAMSQGLGGVGGAAQFNSWLNSAATPKYNMSQSDIGNVSTSRKNSWW
jgi:hypothetical protein